MPQRLVSPLLFLIVFLSSTQLGLHFWPDSALVYGVRVDYLAPTLYLLDTLIVLYLALQRTVLCKTQNRVLWPLVPILLVNLLFSANPPATLSWGLHLLLYFIFISTLNLSLIRLPLVLSLLFQVAIAITQVGLGHSLQGPLYWFGERMVSVGAPAVALGTFMDRVILRAYATFGHPNALAGWLILSFLIILQLKQNPLLKLLSLTLTVVGIIFAQSRSALLTLFGIIIPLLLLRPRLRPFYYLALLLLTCFLSTPLLSPPRSDLSWSQRLNLQGLSLKVITAQPIFGTGSQASISTYPTISPTHRLLQPDHNSFTLFLSWFGLFGVLALLPGSVLPRPLLLLPLAPLLLFDHYLLTSPQGLFILLLYFKLARA